MASQLQTRLSDLKLEVQFMLSAVFGPPAPVRNLLEQEGYKFKSQVFNVAAAGLLGMLPGGIQPISPQGVNIYASDNQTAKAAYREAFKDAYRIVYGA